MINWLKKILGIQELREEVQSLQEERKELSDKIHEKELLVGELDKELEVFRNKEAADEARRNSDEPWVEIRSADYNESRGFRIELDWNDAFIRHLKENGIKGNEDDEIVQKWLAMMYQHLVEKLETQVIESKDQKGTVSDYV